MRNPPSPILHDQPWETFFRGKVNNRMGDGPNDYKLPWKVDGLYDERSRKIWRRPEGKALADRVAALPDLRTSGVDLHAHASKE
jgi:hypothetical protein